MLELVFVKLLETSIQASVFILAVFLIRLCFKRLPKRYICILWALVAVRLVLPFEITSTISLVPDTGKLLSWTNSSLQMYNEGENTSIINTFPNADFPYQETEVQKDTLHTTESTSNGSSTPTKTEEKPLQSQDTPTQETANNTHVVMNNTSRTPIFSLANLSITTLLSYVWLIGTLLLLTYGITSYLRLKWKLRTAVHAQGNIWYAEQIPSPFVLGYLKPRIYVPFSIHEEQLPYIIAHEQAHISHLDHLSKSFAALLLNIYWFNPFIWMAYLLYCKDLELACDERVIQTIGTAEKKAYSEALLICSVSNKALLQSPLAFSEVAIKDRIVNILNYKKPGFWSVMIALILCVGTGICFLTSPRSEEPFLEELNTYLSEGAIISKADYDSDGTLEYALYKSEGTGSGFDIKGITILEPENQTLQSVPFTIADMREQLQCISYQYIPENESFYIYTNNNTAPVILDAAWLTAAYGYPFTRLHWGDMIDFEERDGQWWIIATAGLLPEKGVSSPYNCGAIFKAPVTYHSDHTFELGNISVELYDEKPYTKETLTLYADQLEKFPGEATITDSGQLMLSVSADDYGCLVSTDPATKNTIFVWPDDYTKETLEHVWPPTPLRELKKNYPLKIVKGNVQEVPAYILTESDLSQYNFSADVLETTYTLHPYGIKQYILRDNGTLHVNIGYEAPDHLSFQYLTFEISYDYETASLADYGSGYYLLQLNNVSALDAFRKTYTGEGRILPSDTSQLPWDWLLTLNGEENDVPLLKESQLPEVQQNLQFASFAHFNLLNHYNGFLVSEKVINDEVFTEFRYQDETDDIIILTDIHDGTVLSITFNGEEKPLPEYRLEIATGSIGGSYACPYYIDIIYNEKKELIFMEGYRDQYSCHVFNPITMEEYSDTIKETDPSGFILYPSFYPGTSQYLKDMDWDNMAKRLTPEEQNALPKYLPFLTDDVPLWIFRDDTIDSVTGERVYIKKQQSIREFLAEQYDRPEITLVEPIVNSICFADLFQTGNLDFILHLENYNYQWLIFHEEDGIMYCIYQYERWFHYPLTNGVYTSSNGAGDTDYLRMTFENGSFSKEQIGRIIMHILYLDDVKQRGSVYEVWEAKYLSAPQVPYYTPIVSNDSLE